MMKRGREAEMDFGSDLQRKRQAGGQQAQMFVEAVKTGQRASGNFKQAWYNYCERNGTNMFDPAKHEQMFLSGFFDQLGTAFLNFEGGMVPAPMMHHTSMMHTTPMAHHAPVKGAGKGAGTAGGRGDFAATSFASKVKHPSFNKLAELLKQGQRNDTSWKQLWVEWCGSHGKGVQDPGKHEPIFIIAFIMKFGLAQVVEADWAAPYLVALGEVAKPYLVGTIKRGQGMSAVWKDSWSAFAETASQNANLKMTTRDPNRHDAGTLMEFFDTIAMPDFSEEPWMEMWLTGGEDNTSNAASGDEGKEEMDE